MNTAVEINMKSVRPVGQNVGMSQNDRQPGDGTSAEDLILSRLDSMINTLCKIRFVRVLRQAEIGQSSTLERLNLAIGILRKVRFIRTLKKIRYS